jgi:tetratricopeptide (TPR) repeat protein
MSTPEKEKFQLTVNGCHYTLLTLTRHFSFVVMGVVGIFVLLVASVAVVAQVWFFRLLRFFFFFFLVFLGFSSHFIVQDARALRRQGDDALLLRKWDEAIDVLSKSILLEKENWLGFQKRASAYAGAGLLAKAIDDLNTVLSLKPDHVKSVIKRAELLVQLGKFHDAAISLNGVSGKV